MFRTAGSNLSTAAKWPERARDARIAALMMADGIQRLLTFNTADFPRSWGVEAAHPKQFVTV